MIKPVSSTGRRTVQMSPTGVTSLARWPVTLGGCRPRFTRATLLIGTLVVCAVAGCGGGSGLHAQTRSASSPPTTTATSPAPTPTHALTERQRATAAVLEQVVRYERLLSELAVHPRLSLNRLDSVSTEPDLAEEIRSMNVLRTAGDRQSGLGTMGATRVNGISLAHRASRHGTTYPTAHVTTCLDVSRVHGYGPGGQSIVPRNRKPFLLTHLTLVNTSYPDASGWLVSKVSDREQDSCKR
jgi:hypothetical protein